MEKTADILIVVIFVIAVALFAIGIAAYFILK